MTETQRTDAQPSGAPLSAGNSAGNPDDPVYAAKVAEITPAINAHLEARRETRWHVFDENLQHPERDDEHFGQVYIESVMGANGSVRTFERPLVKEARYEHPHR